MVRSTGILSATWMRYRRYPGNTQYCTRYKLNVIIIINITFSYHNCHKFNIICNIISITRNRIGCLQNIISVIHVSNVTGLTTDIKKVISIAKAKKIPVCIDGTQAVAHSHVDLKELDCDFYAFSSHKIYGPTGVGILYMKNKWIEQLKRHQFRQAALMQFQCRANHDH